jgi:hypothetical protein
MTSPNLSTQYHLVADFDSQKEYNWDRKSFNFKRWSLVVVFTSSFNVINQITGLNIVRNMVVSSCSLCPHAFEQHHHFAEPGADTINFDSHNSLVSLPSDYSFELLLAPCHHAKVALSFILQAENKPMAYFSYEDLQHNLLSICTNPLPEFVFPYRQVLSEFDGILDLYATSDRLYNVFVTVSDGSGKRVFCSSCNSFWRTTTPCTHMRDHQSINITKVDNSSSGSRSKSAKSRHIHSLQHYPCMLTKFIIKEVNDLTFV